MRTSPSGRWSTHIPRPPWPPLPKVPVSPSPPVAFANPPLDKAISNGRRTCARGKSRKSGSPCHGRSDCIPDHRNFSRRKYRRLVLETIAIDEGRRSRSRYDFSYPAATIAVASSPGGPTSCAQKTADNQRDDDSPRSQYRVVVWNSDCGQPRLEGAGARPQRASTSAGRGRQAAG